MYSFWMASNIICFFMSYSLFYTTKTISSEWVEKFLDIYHSYFIEIYSNI